MAQRHKTLRLIVHHILFYSSYNHTHSCLETKLCFSVKHQTIFSQMSWHFMENIEKWCWPNPMDWPIYRSSSRRNSTPLQSQPSPLQCVEKVTGWKPAVHKQMQMAVLETAVSSTAICICSCTGTALALHRHTFSDNLCIHTCDNYCKRGNICGSIAYPCSRHHNVWPTIALSNHS